MEYIRMNSRNKRWGEKAQLSVFIILAIMIVIVLFFLFRGRSDIGLMLSKSDSPVDKIQKCIRDSAKDATIKIGSQGGSFDPKNYYLYEDNKVDYLCYTEQYYKACIMQKPLLKQSMEQELKKYLDPKIKDCIDSIKGSLENQGYSVDYKNPESTVQLIPNSILIDTAIELKLSKDSKVQSYKNIKTDIGSRLYEFAMTASSISNWEARYGDSETMMYMFYYPTLKVEKKIRDDGTRIYILSDRESGEKFLFAVRSVALPSGITGK
ncbi:Uncharacterised protein [uncultured archaeon]|nr:Uncharacterised protein [uncultured archaeon]